MRPTVTLRKATINDANLLATISSQSFEEAFGEANTPENMETFLSTAFTPEKVAAELIDLTSEFYVAELAGSPAGYLKLNWPAPNNLVPFNNVLKICRLYLLRKFLGLGLGDQLMHFCIQRARECSCEAVWLTVWEHNPRAISFYTKWGFVQKGTEDFVLGDDVQLDYVMMKPLQNG